MKRLNANQWMAISSLILLGPALRLLPQLTAAAAGRAAWLSVLPALPLLLFYAGLFSRWLEKRPARAGLPELLLQALGEKPGKALLLLLSLWLCFYGGFLLRSGADRLVVTVYPHSGPAVFAVSMGLACALAALGSARSLGRCAKLMLVPVLGMLLFLLLFAAKSVDTRDLLPVTVYDLPGITRAALPVLDVLSLGLFLPLFLLGQTDTEEKLLPRYSRWLLTESLLLCLLILAVVGNFGAGLTAQLSHPFFTLVRNQVFFQSLERIEALIVSCWVFPDFLLVSLCLYAAQYCLRLALGAQPQRDSGRHTALGDKRWLIPFCALASILVALTLAPDLASLRLWSERIVPAVNLSLWFLLLPLCLMIGKIRRKTAP